MGKSRSSNSINTNIDNKNVIPSDNIYDATIKTLPRTTTKNTKTPLKTNISKSLSKFYSTMNETRKFR
ncbi:hypothetical protein H8356DRAFT_1343522 [Neocallimastix lanati (nom. inval.)]|nr:hypothetical protein H8356DRAFT_1343522 [Neocallimastix sp. JGI-2020a]